MLLTSQYLFLPGFNLEFSEFKTYIYQNADASSGTAKNVSVSSQNIKEYGYIPTPIILLKWQTIIRPGSNVALVRANYTQN